MLKVDQALKNGEPKVVVVWGGGSSVVGEPMNLRPPRNFRVGA